MVCTASDLQGWKDFPKGLRVLLLDSHADSANEIRSKLEEMEYIVYMYRDENEALSAIASKNETFHVAIVEVSASNCEGSLKFLESAKDLPTVMTSNLDCLNTTMKCIALGAVEFLRRPLSEDKLRNIWQHVLHKAFNAGVSGLSVSLKPIKESVLSILQLRAEKGEDTMQISAETDVSSEKNGEEKNPEGSDHYPAPSTPQLGGQLVDDEDCQEQSNHSFEKSVDIICDDSPVEDTLQVGQLGLSEMKEVKMEEESNNLRIHNTNNSGENVIKTSDLETLCRTRSNRKKIKVDWTSELHKKFVKAVDQLGIHQAIPSRILELMKVEGLTRHNVASHLQKYRMQRRQILPKEEDTGWTNRKDSTRRTCTYYQQRPIMAFPPYYTYNYNYDLQKLTSPVYPIWGQTGAHRGGVHSWTAPPYHPHWPPLNAWHWQTSPEFLHKSHSYLSGVQVMGEDGDDAVAAAAPVRADAWGCPVMPPPHDAYSTYSQNISSYNNSRTVDNGFSMTLTSVDLQPDEEVIDMVVKEAMSKPWLPLPLGLKPPSTDSVLTELSRQGISTVPSHITGSRPR